jgi:hypothetical protein
MKDSENKERSVVTFVSTSPTAAPPESSRYRIDVLGTSGWDNYTNRANPQTLPDFTKFTNWALPVALAPQTSMALLTPADQAQARFVKVSGTRTADQSVNLGARAYPHIVEVAQPAFILMQRALEDARLALDSYDDGDIEGVASRLSAIAAQCAKAHPSTEFNESFGAVVSFVRRAAIAADASQITRVAVNRLIHALKQLTDDPMIDLAAAGDLISSLTDDGWHGEYEAVDRLLSLLTEDEIQSSLELLPDDP